MKLLTILVCSSGFFLAGCATQPRGNYVQSVLDQLNAKCQQDVDNPEFSPILSKMTLDGGNVSLEKMSITETVTAQEKPLIEKLEQVLATCNQSKVLFAQEIGSHGVR